MRGRVTVEDCLFLRPLERIVLARGDRHERIVFVGTLNLRKQVK